jgi:hypothetical protein
MTPLFYIYTSNHILFLPKSQKRIRKERYHANKKIKLMTSIYGKVNKKDHILQRTNINKIFIATYYMFGYSQLIRMNTHLTWHKGTSKVYQMVAYLVFQGSLERLLYPQTKTDTASLDSDRSNLICSTERISNTVVP